MAVVVVKCVRGDGDRPAPSINDQMLITQAMALLRGARFLDDPDQGGYYNLVERTFKVPHKSSLVLPTKWVSVTDSHLGLSAKKVRVKDLRIEITPTSVWTTLTTCEYKEPV